MCSALLHRVPGYITIIGLIAATFSSLLPLTSAHGWTVPLTDGEGGDKRGNGEVHTYVHSRNNRSVGIQIIGSNGQKQRRGVASGQKEEFRTRFKSHLGNSSCKRFDYTLPSFPHKIFSSHLFICIPFNRKTVIKWCRQPVPSTKQQDCKYNQSLCENKS